MTNKQQQKKITFFGKYSIYSIRDALYPRFQFDIRGILLLITALIPVINLLLVFQEGKTVSVLLFSISYPELSIQTLFVKTFLILLWIDLNISALYFYPIQYVKHGIAIQKQELKTLILNYDFSMAPIKQYVLYLVPRLIVYLFIGRSIETTTDPVVSNLINNIVIVIFLISYILYAALIIVILITFLMLGLGFLLDDYLDEGRTYSTIQEARIEISKQAKELDKIIDWINEPRDVKIFKTSTEQYRKKIASSLYKIRKFIALETDKDEHPHNADTKRKYTQAEKALEQELLTSLRKEKCVVCYASLKDATGDLLVCPVCGQGGHKAHLDSWFETGHRTCPVCASNLEVNNYLVLSS